MKDQRPCQLYLTVLCAKKYCQSEVRVVRQSIYTLAGDPGNVMAREKGWYLVSEKGVSVGGYICPGCYGKWKEE